MTDDVASPPPSEPTQPAPPEPQSEPASVSSEIASEAQPPTVSEQAPTQPIAESSVAPLETKVPPPEVEPPQEQLPPTPSTPSPQIMNIVSIPIVDVVARAHAYASRVRKREGRLTRIMEFVQKEGKIGNADIVRLLHISDATASRYARMLVAQSRLKPEGNGRGRKYVAAP